MKILQKCISSETYCTQTIARTMHQFNVFKDTKGFLSVWEYMLRYSHIIDEKTKEKVEKINALLKEEGITDISDSTVGRIIKDLKERGKIPKSNKISLYGKTGALRDKRPQKKRKKLRIKDYKPK